MPLVSALLTLVVTAFVFRMVARLTGDAGEDAR
jgi:hypothetical protein